MKKHGIYLVRRRDSNETEKQETPYIAKQHAKRRRNRKLQKLARRRNRN